MEITIHRPAQIGGQITKISTACTSIIIDLGHNLPGVDDKDLLANDETIAEITRGCSAVLYTHYHGDHIGLFHHVPSDIPQYIGAVARRVVCRKYEQLCRLPDDEDKERYASALEIASRMTGFREKERLQFGDITVIPYLVSHSAYDAYMFLIEAEGKRILHTGDFRGHGYLSKGLLPVISRFVGRVDVLITEGTMLKRREEEVLTEKALSEAASAWMKKYKYVFIHCSSTDMERLAGFKNAYKALFPLRPLVSDSFQKDILGIFSDTAGKRTKCFDFGTIYSYAEPNHKLKKWMTQSGFAMFVRATQKYQEYLDQILPMLSPSDTLFIYSMWSGYIDEGNTQNPEYVKLQKRFTGPEFPSKVLRLHTSGHATVDTLREVCQLTNPRLAIIPIHRDDRTDFRTIGISPELQQKVITTESVVAGIRIYFA